MPLSPMGRFIYLCVTELQSVPGGDGHFEEISIKWDHLVGAVFQIVLIGQIGGDNVSVNAKEVSEAWRR